MNDRPIAKLEVERLEGSDVGVFYTPVGHDKFPAILFLHGSEGRHAPFWPLVTEHFARHGFVSKLFGYCRGGTNEQQGDIHDFELSETVAAISALRNHPRCNGKVGLYGVSRGAEHALLVASLMARDGMVGMPDALAVHAPADVVVAAFIASAWSSNPKQRTVWDPAHRAWLWKGSARELMPSQPIEIERYPGPLLISTGEKDDVWAPEMTRRLETRLKAAGRQPQVHWFPDEKHDFSREARGKVYGLAIDFFRQTLVPWKMK